MIALPRVLLLLFATALASRASALDPPAISVLSFDRRPLADGSTISCDENQNFPVAVSVSPAASAPSKWRVTASVSQAGLSYSNSGETSDSAIFQMFYNTTGLVSVHVLVEGTGSSSARSSRSIQLFFICPSTAARTPRITCDVPPPRPPTPPPNSDVYGQAPTRYAADMACASEASARYPESKGAHLLAGMIQRLLGNWEGAIDALAAASGDGGGQPRDVLPNSIRGWVDTQLRELQQLEQQQQQRQQQQQHVWKRTTLQSRLTPPGGDGRTYISIVMVGRHDNTQFCQHAPDACLDRARASGMAWLSLLQKHRVPAELIYVEWNPYLDASQYQSSDDVEESREDSGAESAAPDPPATPEFVRLADFFEREGHFGLPALAGGASVRVITVPLDVHASYWNPYDFDLLEFIGKNVAGRRARGKFLMFTNPDDIPSEGLVKVFARQLLKEDTFYGGFRGVVSNHVPLFGPHVTGASVVDYVQRYSYTDITGTLMEGQSEDSWPSAPCEDDVEGGTPVRTRAYGSYYDSAAGDFCLLPSVVFHAIRGFAEIPNNIFMDGTAIHAAAAHGYGQQVFKPPCSIYHQAHPRSFNTKGTLLTFPRYQELAQELLLKGKKANINDDGLAPEERNWSQFNDEDWGLLGVQLEEEELKPALQGGPRQEL